MSSSTTTLPGKMSPREKAELEERILTACNIADPILNTPIRTLGWLKRVTFGTEDNDSMIIHLRVPTMLHPALDYLQSEILRKARGVAIANDASRSDDDGNNENCSNVRVDVSVAPTQPMNVLHLAKKTFASIEEEEKEQQLRSEKLGPGLERVTQFLAVYSCKGGVGKSTIAANLAYALAQKGGRVGLLDADVYGPSLPVIIHPDDDTVRRSPQGAGMVFPIEHEGVKMISLGFVSPKSGVPGSGADGGASVMRGPMAGRVVTQLLKGTDWGELDVLILDLPPGTGDVQLTICQELTLSGAVSVTTPSKLAVADAIKGVEMFDALGVRTLAAVENMSYFECEGGTKHYPFGGGLKTQAITTTSANNSSSSRIYGLDSSNIFQMPISEITNSSNDDGIPLCLSRPSEGANVELKLFDDLANAVSKQLFCLLHGRSPLDGSTKTGVMDGSSSTGKDGEKQQKPVLTFGNAISDEVFDLASINLSADNDRQVFIVRLFSETGATQIEVAGEDLRSRHPRTGEILDVDNVADAATLDEDGGKASGAGCGGASGDGMVHHHTHDHDHSHAEKSRLFPTKCERKGYYGYSVEWADGATIIYSMQSIAKSAGGIIS